MTKIDKVLKELSELYEFNRKIKRTLKGALRKPVDEKEYKKYLEEKYL